MRRILIVSHSPHLCGAERMALNLAIMLRRSGAYQPIMLVPDAQNGILASKLDEADVEWCDVPYFHWFQWYDSANLHNHATQLRDHSLHFVNLIAALNADLVIVNTMTSLECAIAAAKINIPILLWVHGVSDLANFPNYGPFAKLCEDSLLRVARKVVYCSHWTASGYRGRCEENKSEVIHNWTDVLPLRSRARAKSQIFVTLSTLETHKGVDLAIKAVALLRDRGQSVRLEIYGNGPDQHDLLQLSVDLKLTGHVRFLGRVDDVNPVYDDACALLFPSYIEPFGMLAIESMSRMTPVIAAKVGGLKEIVVDGVNGLFFEPGDVAGLAEKMCLLLDNRDVAERLGAAGFRRVDEAFTEEIALPKFAAAMDAACDEFKGYDAEDYSVLQVFEALALDAVRPSVSEKAAGSPATRKSRRLILKETRPHKKRFPRDQIREIRRLFYRLCDRLTG